MCDGVQLVSARNSMRPDMSTADPTSAPCVKLIDFGLSKHFHPHEIMTQQVGTAYYVAPDVLQGQYTAACDMVSKRHAVV